MSTGSIHTASTNAESTNAESIGDQGVVVHHVALYVADLDATKAFYTGVLGMHELQRPADFTFPGAYFRLGTAEIHVVVETVAGRADELRPRWSDEELRTGYTVHFALGVPDIDGMHARIVAAGGTFVGGPRIRADDVEQWYLADPDGHVIELIAQRTPERAAERRAEIFEAGDAVPVAPGYEPPAPDDATPRS